MKVSMAKSALCAAVLSALLAGGAQAQDGNEQELLQLASRGETQAASELISRRTDVNVAQSDGTTALHWAVYHGDLKLVEQLLRRKADVNARNNYGATPLSQAAVTGDPAIIKQLLRAGADVNERGADDQTALMIISRTSN